MAFPNYQTNYGENHRGKNSRGLPGARLALGLVITVLVILLVFLISSTDSAIYVLGSVAALVTMLLFVIYKIRRS